MAKILSLLWLLGCCRSQTDTIDIKMISNPPRAFGTKVEFKCESSYMDAGVFWILQKSDGTHHFISHVTSRSKEATGILTGYKSSKTGNYYQLTIASFQEEHEATYYCVCHRNQKLLFSSGTPVYRPVKTTTMRPTTSQQIVVTSKGLVREEAMKCPNSTVIAKTNPEIISCEFYIWVPLAGVSLLLLILVIIISVCCGPRRSRRKCKCKRPTNGTNGTHTKPFQNNK
ncbi:T-cell surface glycoprotein CD8 alpha chain isoform 2-T2 [Liasis olivaceus]